ncbi:Ig-like domain-containing protein [Reichenbachiella carrageenanivorans]|uniref:Ig-like domain-containing protein n=1 Tax=Reichenbachiella carrageenanivorans TaxID=2979869 RepID=A0ABY6CVA2_9BACT|nr:Ig-like domain-containing protein [Reichenbachiella carrageenanivorans]UXX77664.1 Ig-like domain-containing protein [Reichenbachiella carrageenanivorans]
MKSVTWESDNPSATVNENTGVVTGISPGTATITATDGSGITGSIEVTVFPPDP